MTIANRTVSVTDLKRAIEGRDASALIALYAEDALLRTIDQDNPPSKPRVLQGKPAIASYYEDMCGRAMSHHVDSTVTNGDAISFTQTCTYPDGTKVFCAATLETKDGKIAHQTTVQAWDS